MPGPRRGDRRSIDRNFPYQVDITVPDTGLGTRVNDMHAFIDRHGLKVSGIAGARKRPRDVASWCFAEAADADRFAAEFGGERVDVVEKEGWYQRVTAEWRR